MSGRQLSRVAGVGSGVTVTLDGGVSPAVSCLHHPALPAIAAGEPDEITRMAERAQAFLLRSLARWDRQSPSAVAALLRETQGTLRRLDHRP